MVGDHGIQRGLRLNRFQLCTIFSQVFIVDVVSQQMDRKLNFIFRNQNVLFVKLF